MQPGVVEQISAGATYIRKRIRELSRHQKYYSQMDVVYNLAGVLINIFYLAAIYRHVSVIAFTARCFSYKE